MISFLVASWMELNSSSALLYSHMASLVNVCIVKLYKGYCLATRKWKLIFKLPRRVPVTKNLNIQALR